MLAIIVPMIPSGHDDDLEYFVRTCGDIAGVKKEGSRTAKDILAVLLREIVDFKKL